MPIRDNKFARQAGNLTRRNTAREEKATFEQQLARLEEDIRRLKIEYDIFFNGASKRPPYDTKNRVETTLKRLADERSLTFAQRFQYNALAVRYNSFKELWRRTMQGREEGRAAIKQASNTADEPQPAKMTEQFTFSNAAHEDEVIKKMYDALIQAKQSCNESVNEINYERFKQQLAAQTEKLKQNSGCNKVSVKIGVENERVVFKARSAKENEK